jgi:hypothetical protein
MFSQDSNSDFFSTFSKIIQHAAKTTNLADSATFSIYPDIIHCTSPVEQTAGKNRGNRYRSKGGGHFAPGN